MNGSGGGGAGAEKEMNADVSGMICPLCGDTDVRSKYRFEDCSILRCRRCTFMWLHPKPDLEQLHKVYDDHYYSNREFFRRDGTKLYGYVDYLAERINKQYDYQRVVSEMAGLVGVGKAGGPGHPEWLDVGCGLGFLMDVAFDKGFGVRGVEFNRAAVRYIRSKYTFPVDYGLLGELEFGAQRFDVISLFDVIEHMDDPMAAMRTLRGLAREGSYCLIQTMDSDSVVSRLIGERLEDFRRTREHLYFFTRESMRRMLSDCGWEVVRIRSIGHTFQLDDLIERISVYSGVLSKVIRALVYPRWLLAANFYVNPGTKMLVYARPK